MQARWRGGKRSVANARLTGGESNVTETLLDSLRKIKNFLIFIFFTIALVALILPGSVLSDHTRSVYYLWESGHFILFFLGCHLFYACYPRILHFPFARQSVILLGITFLCVLVIEGLQSNLSGKPFESSDVIADTAGTLLFLSFRSRRNGNHNFFLHGPAFLLTGFALWPVFSAFCDEMLARYQFPLLADFETPLEKGRFVGRTGSGALTSDQAFHGRHSLRLSLLPGPWSGMTLKYFPSDWNGYTQLHFAVYNPGWQQSVSLEVWIRDISHEQGNKPYNDLYSQIIVLPPGWTEVQIPLAEIEKGPQSRKMDLAHITGLGFFVEQEERPLTLYLDTIRLE